MLINPKGSPFYILGTVRHFRKEKIRKFRFLSFRYSADFRHSRLVEDRRNLEVAMDDGNNFIPATLVPDHLTTAIANFQINIQLTFIQTIIAALTYAAVF